MTLTDTQIKALKSMAGSRYSKADGGEHGTRRWFAPKTPDALADVLAQHPGARMVAGATDVGLWVTKGLRDIDTLVFLGGVAQLDTIAENPAGLTLGAMVRYADAHAAYSRDEKQSMWKATHGEAPFTGDASRKGAAGWTCRSKARV